MIKLLQHSCSSYAVDRVLTAGINNSLQYNSTYFSLFLHVRLNICTFLNILFLHIFIYTSSQPAVPNYNALYCIFVDNYNPTHLSSKKSNDRLKRRCNKIKHIPQHKNTAPAQHRAVLSVLRGYLGRNLRFAKIRSEVLMSLSTNKYNRSRYRQ